MAEAPSAHAIEPERLAHWLRATLGIEGPLTIEKFPGGQSNPTFLISSPAHRYVLRRKPPGTLLPSAHLIEREYRVLAALAVTDVPVARVYALCEDPGVIGSAFYLMDYVPGRIFWDAALPEVTAAERRPIYEEMLRVLARLHALDPAAAGLADYGKHERFIERQIDRWSRQYRAAEQERLPAMEQLIEWLPRHVPAEEPVRLVHGDYRLDNVIFDAHAPRIRAVLDWELSTLGAPLTDLAYFCMRFHLPVADWGGLAGLELEALGIPGEAECVAHYCRERGCEPPATQVWAYYLAFGMFRLVSILTGVLARGRAGNASNASAEAAGRRAAPLATLAWQLIERRS